MILDYPEFGCKHEFPDDWELGGACGGDVRADPRWMPSTYEYLDKLLRRFHITTVPICDHEALMQFTDRAEYIIATRPNGAPEMIKKPEEMS